MQKHLSPLFQQFLFESEYSRRIRPATLAGYKQAYATFSQLNSGCTTSDLTPGLMVQFFKGLQERKRVVGKGVIKVGVKKSTVSSYWNKLSAFFSWLKLKGHIKENPFSQLKCPTPSYEDKQFLTKADIEKILTAIHVHTNGNALILKRNLVIFYLLLFCGLRKEELMFLQVRDVDLLRRELTVRAETSKSARTRVVPLSSTVVLYLKDYLSERKDYKTPYLIVSSLRDDRFSYEGLKHLVNKLKLASGVNFHLHQFRHTFAMNFLKTSNNLAKLKQLLGHSNIATTMIYLRAMPVEELRGDVENLRIENLI